MFNTPVSAAQAWGALRARAGWGGARSSSGEMRFAALSYMMEAGLLSLEAFYYRSVAATGALKGVIGVTGTSFRLFPHAHSVHERRDRVVPLPP